MGCAATNLFISLKQSRPGKCAQDIPWIQKTHWEPDVYQVSIYHLSLTCITLTRAHKATSGYQISMSAQTVYPKVLKIQVYYAFPKIYLPPVNGCRSLWERLGNFYYILLFANPSSWLPDLFFSQWILVLRTVPDVKTGQSPSFLITHP